MPLALWAALGSPARPQQFIEVLPPPRSAGLGSAAALPGTAAANCWGSLGSHSRAPCAPLPGGCSAAFPGSVSSSGPAVPPQSIIDARGGVSRRAGGPGAGIWGGKLDRILYDPTRAGFGDVDGALLDGNVPSVNSFARTSFIPRCARAVASAGASLPFPNPREQESGGPRCPRKASALPNSRLAGKPKVPDPNSVFNAPQPTQGLHNSQLRALGVFKRWVNCLPPPQQCRRTDRAGTK